ncbi:CubicO group peptidase (beta-lactamase class C family) [Pedobacter cryoconitis]|uniref:CubicO group peptidase (Beta-lactamase class C family) n=1 Tax=Pedobacter cryoconitis TaxID=188932 RepID=A0A7W8YU65_9SPHI|nr:serine hydrolase domain-containing protein [Pedobacter cryoconitis]MBB5621854.1 CubicO group peptidase (beta-lactamase class C family) [Pedobacter cryoconitis]
MNKVSLVIMDCSIFLLANSMSLLRLIRMKKWKQLIIGSTLLCVCTQIAYGQSRFDSLTTSLAQIVKKESLTGMSVVLVNSKKIMYEQNFGYADVAKKTKYSAQTIQVIGSVSKTFLAIALMKAVESGYFNLETKINDILPFKVINPSYPTASIKVRELSNHSSSILDNPAIFPDTYQFDEGFAAYDVSAYKVLQDMGYRKKVSSTSLKEFLQDYLSGDGKYYNTGNFADSEPGSSSHYSNIGSALAAYLIEVKSGMTYAEFTEKYILKPLKMQNSSWFLNTEKLAQYARHYYDLETSFPFYECITYPDGGLRTNTTDLSKYLIALINGYHGNQSLLSKKSYQTMFTPQFSKDNPPKGISLANRNKGIFWNLYTNGTIGHDGDDPGVSSFLFFNPATRQGGVFLCDRYLADKSEIIALLAKYTNDIYK